MAGWLLDAAGLPSSYLFGALLVGLVVALRRPGALAVPSPAFRACHAVAGVALGMVAGGASGIVAMATELRADDRLAVGLSLSDGFAVPPVLREIAFAGIGLQVGLRFTVATVREVGSLLFPVLGCVVGLMVTCFGHALVLDLATSATLLDSYLATTPGGLLAVLAAAFGSGADTTFVLAVQTLRMFVMVLPAPAVVRVLVRSAPPLA